MTDAADKSRKCSVRDGRFVEACDGLSSMIDNIAPGFSKKKGIASWSLTNMDTLKPSRRYIGAVTDNFKNGMLFNFCPICGENISAPFMEGDVS